MRNISVKFLEEKMSVLEGIAQAYYQQFTMIPKITHKINTVSNGSIIPTRVSNIDPVKSKHI